MNINEAIALAGRLESIVRRANMFGPKTRDEILEEITDMANDLKSYADRLDRMMDNEYQKELSAGKIKEAC